MSIVIKHAVSTLALVAAVAPWAVAHAQDAAAPGNQAASATSGAAEEPSYGIDEIIVTAQKRSESIKDVPLAISAIAGDQLLGDGVARPGDLGSTVPNLQSFTSLGVTSVFLRGVGNGELSIGSDSSIGYYADGVYIARPRAQTAGFFDVERIEVVRGPQGDLYGRNATGGAINIITRKPTSDLSGDFSASYGNYDSIRLDGAVGGPIAGDTVKARVAGFFADRDGYGRNLVTGNKIDGLHEYGARLSLLMEPSADLSIELIADYYKAKDSTGAFHNAGTGRPDIPLAALRAGGIVADDIRDIAADRDPYRNQRAYGFAGTVTYDVSDAVTLKSITGYRNSRSLFHTSVTGGSVFSGLLDQFEKDHHFSQEVQLLLEGDRWNAIVGGYYFNEKLDGDIFIPLARVSSTGAVEPVGTLRQLGTLKTDAYAAFGNVNWEFVDNLKLIMGLRYSYEKRSSLGAATLVATTTPIDDKENWDALTPRVTLQYQPSRNLQFYATIAKGFKSGAFTNGQVNSATDPETILDYEAGVKYTTPDNTFSLSAAAFYYDYTNLVVSRVINRVPTNENAAKASIKGFEIEAVLRPSRHFRVDASFGYLDGKYGEYETEDPTFPPDPLTQTPREIAEENDRSGNTLPNAPEFTARVGAEYMTRLGNGDLSIAGNLKFRSMQYYTPFNLRNTYSPATAEIGANINYKLDNGLRFGIFGRNLTNETVITRASISSLTTGYAVNSSLNEPRTYGVTVGYQF